MNGNSPDVKIVREAFKEALKEIGGEFVGITANIPPLEHEHIEYEQQRDEENFYDEDSKCFNFEGSQLYHKISQTEYSNNELTLTYFVDGSLRAHYWGDIVVGMYFFPIVLGETVVAIVKRNNVNFKTYGIEHYVNIILPAETFSEVSVFREKLQKNLEGINYVRVVSVERAEKEDKKSKSDARMILLAKVRSVLHNDECAIIDKICRCENEVVVLDGDLRSEIFKDKPKFIGIAKSFSLKPVITLPTGIRPLPEILHNLEVGHRTCVFAKETEPQYKFWYVRLHPSEVCETYFSGVVKIEVNQKSIREPTAEFIDFVNTVSYLVYKERNPTSYPTRRWASHIYPIYIAEKIAKSHLTSVEVLRQKFKIV